MAEKIEQYTIQEYFGPRLGQAEVKISVLKYRGGKIVIRQWKNPMDSLPRKSATVEFPDETFRNLSVDNPFPKGVSYACAFYPNASIFAHAKADIREWHDAKKEGACRCGKPAEYGCHGIVDGQVQSFIACAAHKDWSPEHAVVQEEEALAEQSNDADFSDPVSSPADLVGMGDAKFSGSAEVDPALRKLVDTDEEAHVLEEILDAPREQPVAVRIAEMVHAEQQAFDFVADMPLFAGVR